MSTGIRYWDASGNVTFDSPTAVGFLPVGLFEIAAGASGFTSTYPDLAGFTPSLVSMDAGQNAVTGVTVDVSLGYPRMTVVSHSAQRLWILVVA